MATKPAVALGNQKMSPEVIQSLENKKTETSSELVHEHIDWAIQQMNALKVD